MKQEEKEKVASQYAWANSHIRMNKETFETEGNIPADKLVMVPVGEMIKVAVLYGMNYAAKQRVMKLQKRKMEKLEKFSIVDFCIANYCHRERDNSVYLADAFKKLHDSYGWKYTDIHAKFKREVEDRRDEVYITRASDIFIRGAERKQLPIYNNQWYSHLMKLKK